MSSLRDVGLADKVVEVSITYQSPNGEITRYRVNGEDAITASENLLPLYNPVNWEPLIKDEEVISNLNWQDEKIVSFGIGS